MARSSVARGPVQFAGVAPAPNRGRFVTVGQPMRLRQHPALDRQTWARHGRRGGLQEGPYGLKRLWQAGSPVSRWGWR